jgi:hypothetical protein
VVAILAASVGLVTGTADPDDEIREHDEAVARSTFD